MAVIWLLSMTTSGFSNFTSLFISISLRQFSFSYFNSFLKVLGTLWPDLEVGIFHPSMSS